MLLQIHYGPVPLAADGCGDLQLLACQIPAARKQLKLSSHKPGLAAAPSQVMALKVGSRTILVHWVVT